MVLPMMLHVPQQQILAAIRQANPRRTPTSIWTSELPGNLNFRAYSVCVMTRGLLLESAVKDGLSTVIVKLSVCPGRGLGSFVSPALCT